MKKDALIMGGSPAGMQAAQDLADSGIEVHLVVPFPFLENSSKTTLPRHLVNSRMLELAKHPQITVWTNTDLTRLQQGAGSFEVQLRRRPRFIDLTRCTGCGDCLEVCPVTVPGTSHKAIYLSNNSQPGCAAIDKIGQPPCTNACPGGIQVQGYVALIAQGRFQEALDLIREAIPFPSICGRICTHPCERNCRRSDVDAPVAIRRLKRFVTDWELTLAGESGKNRNRISPPASKGKRVAIVGSGPAGMTAADRLARWGYGVTVFEKLPVMAGMLAVGVPAYRLPREVIAREYSSIQELGVEIRLNTSIGPNGDFTLEDLFDAGYDAVCLAIGAHTSLTLGIPGEKLSGVAFGLEVLKIISLSQVTEGSKYKKNLQQILRYGVDTRVAVLGGGNTAIDVARSLKRLGVIDLGIFYRRSRAEMPALPEEVAEAELEGIPIKVLTAPLRILGDQATGVVGLECLRMQLGQSDDSGRRRPVPLAGSEFEVPLDLVVLAIGQIPDAELLGRISGLALTRDQRIKVNHLTFETTRPGVFAAGDAVSRDKMSAIEAISMGKKVAAAIDAYLKGATSNQDLDRAHELPVARREMNAADMMPKPRIPARVLPVEKRLRSFAEVEHRYSEQQAVAEARRCLACGPCGECLACVKVCKSKAVNHRQTEKYAHLKIGAIICTSDPDQSSQLSLAEGHGIYRAIPDDPLSGSAAAAHALSHILSPGYGALAFSVSRAPQRSERIGVFICQCGDSIANVVDTQTLCRQAADWAGVVTSQVLPFSCSPEGGKQIKDAVLAHDLNRVTLAACACCSLDQVCYSCSYQRIRCKQNLDIFGNKSSAIQLPDTFTYAQVAFEFVNIREQCAWVHSDDPRAATAKATALISAAVTKTRMMSVRQLESKPIDRSTLILGNGSGVQPCREKLINLGIAVKHMESSPKHVARTEGRFVAHKNGVIQKAASLVLIPQDLLEANRLWTAFEPNYTRVSLPSINQVPETRRPGVFYCDPTLDSSVAGAAAAIRVSAWLGKSAAAPESNLAVVNSHRCRGCNNCVTICEFGAPRLSGIEPNRRSVIDPLICMGCGTCAAHCPSGAITAGYSSDAQLEGMIAAVLSDEDHRHQADKVVVFTCNWSAYSGLETAGLEHRDYSPTVYPFKVMCLGRLGPGIILKALERGASGVLMLGCPQGECRYEFGGRRAQNTFIVASDLIRKLGYPQKRLKMDHLAVGDGKGLTDKFREFMDGLYGGRVLL